LTAALGGEQTKTERPSNDTSGATVAEQPGIELLLQTGGHLHFINHELAQFA
jgi:hypothetical protein